MVVSEARLRQFWHAVFSVLGAKLVVINIDYMGLGNRLGLLANFHVNHGLSDTTLLWNRRGWVNCRLRDILRIDGIESLREMSMPPNRLMPPILCHPTKPYYRERGFWRLDVDDTLPDEFWVERNGKRFPTIAFCYERTPAKEIERFSAFYNRLRPSTAVQARIDAVTLPPEVVCVQVRNTVDPNDRANVPRLESIVARMAAFPAHTRFFISTLDASISRVFHAAFGERILELPDKQYRSMIDATADLFLLGRGDTLIVPVGSSFAEAAWWIGGCRQQVVQMPIEIPAAAS